MACVCGRHREPHISCCYKSHGQGGEGARGWTQVSVWGIHHLRLKPQGARTPQLNDLFYAGGEQIWQIGRGLLGKQTESPSIFSCMAAWLGFGWRSVTSSGGSENLYLNEPQLTKLYCLTPAAWRQLIRWNHWVNMLTYILISERWTYVYLFILCFRLLGESDKQGKAQFRIIDALNIMNGFELDLSFFDLMCV